MTTESKPSLEEALFELAVQKTDAAERAAFLDGVCQDNPALRARLDILLEGCFGGDGFLTQSPEREALPPTLAAPASEEVPARMIGRYELLEKIGEGGFGEVWMAEQREPVKRRVALKIIKLGMDSRQVVARFEAERQALAMMDHANIARIFDADVTDAGRPYFVMELVRGIRITDYCDQNQLSTKERLELFIKVCQAIQHAHQKGIIHRDIKPSNILVTLHDGVPVPKVIDFGIAKATQQELTEQTIYTQYAQFIGTPAYMSPEQAEMSGLDIDTRADIYSLGVLLYELLTGVTPFDAKELMASGIDAMRKTIREKEPQRPSTRLATLGADQLTTTATILLREALRLTEKHDVDADYRLYVMNLLGASLSGQKNYADAEPRLRESCQGLQQHQASLSPHLNAPRPDHGIPRTAGATLRRLGQTRPGRRVETETGRVSAGQQSGGAENAAAMKPNGEELLWAEVPAPSELHEVQSSDVLEVTPVEGGELAAAITGGRGHDQVVVAGHFPRRLQLRPNARVLPRDLPGVDNDRKHRQHTLQIRLAARAVFRRGALHSMPQFRNDDGSDFDLLGPVLGKPARQVERALLSPDDDIRIEDYRHLGSGALKAARDCRRSSAQARASSVERSVVARARASSAPVQRPTGAGTSRATGTAASRITTVERSRRARATHSAKLRPAFSNEMLVSFILQTYAKAAAFPARTSAPHAIRLLR